MTASTQALARVAVVTGGMGGLGTALCQHLAKSGMKVAATYSPDNDHVSEWLAEQRHNGFEFKAFGLDVTDYVSCQSAVAQIVAEMGAIDVLVNNAGITRDASIRKMTLENWRAVLHTDLDSIFNMTKQVVDGMVERGWGRIISISSVNGQKGAFGQANYAAAKAGIHGFTKSVALEVAKKGVTVNTVSPGYLRTSMVTKIPADILNTRILPEIPIGRLGEPDEVAALVTFLASSEAAFITGANIAINGGQHMY
ncbi:acetoacetyl-CoA reductase [Alcaligenaceae bacterium CGII-47]|nr:acetoacetyl-CoA reductase [Alcaligenaceae bacterium CGII-47]